jgi:hypothetical protein
LSGRRNAGTRLGPHRKRRVIFDQDDMGFPQDNPAPWDFALSISLLLSLPIHVGCIGINLVWIQRLGAAEVILVPGEWI